MPFEKENSMITNPELTARNDAIARHLGSVLPRSGATVTAASDGSHRTLSLPDADHADAEIVHVLQHLLQKYVALLESSDHGGWSLDEDTTVRTVCTVLSRRAT
jgi:hypothetical protein